MIPDKHTILVITNAPSPGLLSEVLSSQPYDVSYVKWDAKCFESIKKKPFALILIDVDDSPGAGIEVCRVLNKHDAANGIPVIILFTHPELKDKKNAFEANCYDFITKPYSASELLSRINNCLQNQSYLKHLHVLVDKRTDEAQKSAEEAAKSQNFLQRIIDGVNASLMVVNRDYTIALANQAALGMIKSKKIDNTMTCHQLSHASASPCSGAGHVCPLKKVIESKAPVQVEHIHLDHKQKKRIIEVSCSPIINGSGEVTQVIELFRDITQKKQIEKRLQSSEERLSKIFLSNPDAIALLRLSDGKILDVNTSFTEMFGYPRTSCIGRRIDNLDLWVDEQTVETTMILLNRGQAVRNIELTVRRSSGELFAVSVSCDTTTINQETCLILLIRDISERKTAEKEKMEFEKQLQQSKKMESLTLAGGIAHDFNNILSAIMGYTQQVMTALPETSENRKKLETVLKASDRAKDLVSQILAFSRNDGQQLKPLKIQIIVKEALKLLRSSIPSTIKIKQNISSDCEMVLADPTQIHQVIMTICTNSYQAMRKTGGVLAVSLGQVDLSHQNGIGSPGLKAGSYVKITISDTGPGIPKHILDRIFEPNFTTGPKEEGTGLGLAVVHGIVTKLQGAVIVDSAPDCQTTFQIFLPVTSVLEKTAEKKAGTSIPKGSERILFVDDDEVLVVINRAMLKQLGYHVTAVSDSLDALNIFRAAPDAFDLVITDMAMPDMTGDKLAEKILALRPKMPIIFATGYSVETDPELARIKKMKGMKGYLKKPFVQRQLANEIRKCLDNEEQEKIDDPNPDN